MPNKTTLKLTVYSPEISTGSAQQTGYEYDLTIITPSSLAIRGHHANAASGSVEIIPVTGTLSFPNPAAPVISPFTGLIFIYDGGPIIGFPLTLIAQSTESLLAFNLTLAFPAPPVEVYSGAIKFGLWPGPFSDTTASFLAPQ